MTLLLVRSVAFATLVASGMAFSPSTGMPGRSSTFLTPAGMLTHTHRSIPSRMLESGENMVDQTDDTTKKVQAKPSSPYGEGFFAEEPPIDDPSVTCFLAPEWMPKGESAKPWVCTSRSGLPPHGNEEDSY